MFRIFINHSQEPPASGRSVNQAEITETGDIIRHYEPVSYLK